MEWRKSSYSYDTGNCVEVAAAWHTSSYSTNTGNCVEVAESIAVVKVRDTQHRGLGHLEFPAAEWRAFLAGLDEL